MANPIRDNNEKMVKKLRLAIQALCDPYLSPLKARGIASRLVREAGKLLAKA
jgi:hypothetical protein